MNRVTNRNVRSIKNLSTGLQTVFGYINKTNVTSKQVRLMSQFRDINVFKRTDTFARRHMGPQEHEVPRMLEEVGFKSIDVSISLSHARYFRAF